MGTVGTANSPATELAIDRMIELLLEEESDYPSEISFIPADLADFGKLMSEALLEDKPIMVVYPDGCERLIPSASSESAA